MHKATKVVFTNREVATNDFGVFGIIMVKQQTVHYDSLGYKQLQRYTGRLSNYYSNNSFDPTDRLLLLFRIGTLRWLWRCC